MTAQTDPAATPTTDLRPALRSRLHRAFAAMPYLGGAPTPILRPRTEDEVVASLEYLAAILGHHSARHAAMRQELDQLRSDRAALRRLFGTEAASDAEVTE